VPPLVRELRRISGLEKFINHPVDRESAALHRKRWQPQAFLVTSFGFIIGGK
jgi:hypothetical protein